MLDQYQAEVASLDFASAEAQIKETYGIDVDEQKEFHGPRTSISKRNSRAQVFSFEQPLPQGTPTVSAEPGPGLRGASALQTADRSMLPWPA